MHKTELVKQYIKCLVTVLSFDMCLLHQPMVFSRPSGMGIFIEEYEIDIHENMKKVVLLPDLKYGFHSNICSTILFNLIKKTMYCFPMRHHRIFKGESFETDITFVISLFVIFWIILF